MDLAMRLIKDLSVDRAVFVWTGNGTSILSPQLYSLTAARDWWVKHMFDAFEGQERRQSLIDRRRSQTSAKSEADAITYNRRNHQGRRKTDADISVDHDLYTVKLKKLVAGMT